MSGIDPNICRVCSLQSDDNEFLFHIKTDDDHQNHPDSELTKFGLMLSECLSLKVHKNIFDLIFHKLF